MPVKHTEENIEKLSRNIVDSWDMDTLLNYAIERLSDFYKKNKEDFYAEWNTTFE